MKYQKKKLNKFYPMMLKKFFQKNKIHQNQKYSKQSFDMSLMKYLKCPYGEIELVYDVEKNYLISKSIDFAFPIKDGVPSFTEDEMISLSNKTQREISETHFEENDF
jgi:uncharacterized protein YbaR (Trm112 family)